MNDVRNFVQVTPTIATAGQPARNQFPSLAQTGFAVVVNLATTEHPDAIRDEGALTADLGLSYVQVPVPWTAPKPTHATTFFRVMDTFHDERIFVHCIMNYRVSAFTYLYLVHVRGWSEADARTAVFSEWTPDAVWTKVFRWGRDELGLGA